MAKILIFKQNFGRAFSTKIWTFTEKFRFLGILKKLKKSSDIKSLSLAHKTSFCPTIPSNRKQYIRVKKTLFSGKTLFPIRRNRIFFLFPIRRISY